MDLTLITPEILPDNSAQVGILVLGCAITLTLGFTATYCTASATWRGAKDTQTVIVVSVLWALTVISLPGPIFAFHNLTSQNHLIYETQLRNAEQTTEQIKQIASTYDMADLSLGQTPIPLCGPDTQTQRIEATWPGGYGTLVVGTPQDNQCHIDIFDTAGTRLEPKN